MGTKPMSYSSWRRHQTPVSLRPLAEPARRRASVQRLRRVLLGSDGVYGLEDLRPSLAHVPESRVVLRRDEAGMDEAKPRSIVDPAEDQRDDRVQPRTVADVSLMSARPGVDQPFVRDR